MRSTSKVLGVKHTKADLRNQHNVLAGQFATDQQSKVDGFKDLHLPSQVQSLQESKRRANLTHGSNSSKNNASQFNYTFNHSSLQSGGTKKRSKGRQQGDNQYLKSIQFKLNQTLKSLDSQKSKKSGTTAKPANKFKKSIKRENFGSNQDLSLTNLKYDSSVKRIFTNGESSRGESKLYNQPEAFMECAEQVVEDQLQPIEERQSQPSDMQTSTSHNRQASSYHRSIMEEEMRRSIMSSGGNASQSFQRQYKQFEDELKKGEEQTSQQDSSTLNKSQNVSTTLRSFAGQSLNNTKGLQDIPVYDPHEEVSPDDLDEVPIDPFNQRQQHLQLQANEMSTTEQFNLTSHLWSQVTTNPVNSPTLINQTTGQTCYVDDEDTQQQQTSMNNHASINPTIASFPGLDSLSPDQLRQLNEIIQCQDEVGFKNMYFQQLQKQTSPDSGAQMSSFQNRIDTQHLQSDELSQQHQTIGGQERQTMEGTIERIRQELLLMNSTGPSYEADQQLNFYPNQEQDLPQVSQEETKNFGNQEDAVEYFQEDEPYKNLLENQECLDIPTPLPQKFLGSSEVTRNKRSAAQQYHSAAHNSHARAQQSSLFRRSMEKQTSMKSLKNYPSSSTKNQNLSTYKNVRGGFDAMSSNSLQSPLSPILASYRPKNYSKYERPVVCHQKYKGKLIQSNAANQRNHLRLIGIENTSQSGVNTASQNQPSQNGESFQNRGAYGPVDCNKVQFNISSCYEPKTPARSSKSRQKRCTTQDSQRNKSSRNNSSDLRKANQFSFPREKRGLLLKEQQDLAEKAAERKIKKERNQSIILESQNCNNCQQLYTRSSQLTTVRSRSQNQSMSAPRHHIKINMVSDRRTKRGQSALNTQSNRTPAEPIVDHDICTRCKRSKSTTSRRSKQKRSCKKPCNKKALSEQRPKKKKKKKQSATTSRKLKHKKRSSQMKDAATQLSNEKVLNTGRKEASKVSSKKKKCLSSASTSQEGIHGCCNLELEVGKGKHDMGVLQMKRQVGTQTKDMTSVIDKLNQDLNDQLNSSACMPYRKQPSKLSSEAPTLDNQISVAQIQTSQENVFDGRIKTKILADLEPYYDYAVQEGTQQFEAQIFDQRMIHQPSVDTYDDEILENRDQVQELLTTTQKQKDDNDDEMTKESIYVDDDDSHHLNKKNSHSKGIQNSNSQSNNYFNDSQFKNQLDSFNNQEQYTWENMPYKPPSLLDQENEPDIIGSVGFQPERTMSCEDKIQSYPHNLDLPLSPNNYQEEDKEAVTYYIEDSQPEFEMDMQYPVESQESVSKMMENYNLKARSHSSSHNELLQKIGKPFLVSQPKQTTRKNTMYAAPTVSQIRKMRYAGFDRGKKRTSSGQPQFNVVQATSPWKGVNNFDRKVNQRKRLNKSVTYHSIQNRLNVLCDQSTDNCSELTGPGAAYVLVCEKQKEKMLLQKQTHWMKNKTVQLQKQIKFAKNLNSTTFEKIKEEKKALEKKKGRVKDLQLQRQDIEKKIEQELAERKEIMQLKTNLQQEIHCEKLLLNEIHSICAKYKSLLNQRPPRPSSRTGNMPRQASCQLLSNEYQNQFEHQLNAFNDQPHPEALRQQVQNSRKIISNLEQRRDMLSQDIQKLYRDFKSTLVQSTE